MNPLRHAARLILLGALLMLPGMLRAQGSVPPTPSINTSLAAITLENAGQIRSLAQIGRGSIADLAWTPDGARLAVAGSAGLWLYDSAVPEAEPILLEGHPDRVTSLDFSPDGLLVVSGAADGRLRLWDATAGALLWTAEADEDELHQAAFAPDGLTIASSGGAGGADIWDVATGTLIRHLGERGSFFNVYALAFTPDGLLITGSVTGLIQTWDTATGTEINAIEVPDAVYALVVSPDGKTAAASTGFSGRISLWDAVSGEALGTLAGQEGMTRALAFDADGKLLAAGSANGRVLLWDLTTRELRSIIAEGPEPIRAMSISRDGARLAYATHTVGIITYNLLNPDQPGITITGHNALPSGVAISADSSRLLAYGGPGMNWRWDWREGQITPIPVRDGISAIDFGPTRDLVIGADTTPEQGAMLTVWDYAGGTAIPIVDVSGLMTLETSPDDNWVVVSGGESLRVWALADLLAGSSEPFWSMTAPLYLEAAFSPDSQRIAVAVPDRVQVIDIATQAVVMEVPWSGDRFVGDVAWSPDGRMLAVAHFSMTTIYDAATGSVIAELPGDSRFGSALAFSPDSTLLITGSDAYAIEVYETTSWNQLATLSGHTGSIIDLEISADSQMIVSASFDGTVRLWGVPQG